MTNGNTRKIYCCACAAEITARLTTAAEIYPHRPDLAHKAFWKHDACGNYVGCHGKPKKSPKPLGNIPTPELRKARSHIHAILDPIWQSGRMARGQIYAVLTEHLGREYHTAELRTLDEARKIYRAVKELAA